MIKFVYTLLVLMYSFSLTAQETVEMQSMLEATAESTDQEQENDQFTLHLQFLQNHPYAVSSINEEQLLSLLLTPVQVNSFLHYRTVFGPFLNKYELQAIPYWDINTIRRVLPYLHFGKDAGEETNLKNLFVNGRHQLLVRSSSLLEKANGFISDSLSQKDYAGSPLRLFYRYTYQFKQQLWWGITGEKDAGEKFGDFTGFHLFLKRNGILRTIAVGDYVLNIGQGLMLCQGLAFGKTSEVVNVFKQGNLVQPYRSAGEWNFQRGAAVQLQYKKIQATFFGSYRKLSANVIGQNGDQTAFSSFTETGYHRTETELQDKNKLVQQSYGGVLQYSNRQFRLGIAMVNYHFSLPWQPNPAPYNLYAIRGTNWYNAGIHYSYSIRNFFLYGEAAWCATGKAIIQGSIISLHPRFDLSVVYRHFEPGYQAPYARSFSENSSVTNETGFYTGFRFTPYYGWQIQVYTDFFRFPWLRFRADAPGEGSEYLLQVTWVKRKKWEISVRYRQSEKPENQSGTVLNSIVPVYTSNVRMHVERIINRQLTFTARGDKAWFSKGSESKQGWSFFADVKYQFSKPSIALAARGQHFNTDGYDTRIYSYERDLLYAFSIPALYDKGWRYYCQLQGKLPRFRIIRPISMQCWLRWSRTLYTNRESIGSGTDEILGNRRSEWKCQFMVTW
jgi:hypothetical protein